MEDAIAVYNRYNHGEKQGEEISKAMASITQKSTTTNPTMNVNGRDVVIAILVLIIAIQSWVISKKWSIKCGNMISVVVTQGLMVCIASLSRETELLSIGLSIELE